MPRLTLFQQILIVALCASGLVACGGNNSEIPTLMPTLPSTQARPQASRPAPTQAGTAQPVVNWPTTTRPAAATPVPSTQAARGPSASPASDASGADLDKALDDFQQDLNSVDTTGVMSDSTETNADQALNQLGQSIDNANVLSDVIKSLP